MAKKKILTPIVGIGKDINQLTVQKSHPLIDLCQSELTLSEFKILDTYLSRINSHNPDQRVVLLSKADLERCMDLSKINIQDLEERLCHLMSSLVKLTDKDAKKGFKLVTLFEEAVVLQDENGVNTIRLECSQKAMKYFFNIEQKGYLQYKLRCIRSMKSRYTYIMFIYLENNRFRRTWEVDLEKLKEVLKCSNEETYREYKHFNNLVLKKAQKEIHEKTECRYSYTPIRVGRCVKKIQFTIESSNPQIEYTDEPSQDSFPIVMDNSMDADIVEEKRQELWETALEKDGKCEFTKRQLNELRMALATVPEAKLPQVEGTGNDYTFRWYHYIAQKYALFNRVADEREIKNRFAYFLKMVQSDAMSGE